MFTGRTIKIAITALALVPSLAFAGGNKCRLPAGIEVVTGLRPDQPQKVSHQKPKMERLKANAQSWQVVNEQEHQLRGRQNWGGGGRVDPYRLVIEGANKGTVLTVTKKGALQPIAMPEMERVALRDNKGRRIETAKFRKIVNADYNKALAKAVAMARPDEALNTATQQGYSSAQPVAIDSNTTLPTNTTLTVSGKDPFGRKYQAREFIVEGAGYTDSGWSNWNSIGNNVFQRVRNQSGGRFQASEAAQLVRQNLRSTPVLERVTKVGGWEKVNGQWQRKVERQTYAKVLGLAAFSPRSTVTITNLRMEALGGDHQKRASVTFASNNKGAGAIEVPAEMGDEFRITVQTRNGAEIQGAQTSTIIKVPVATKDSKFMHDRYLSID